MKLYSSNETNKTSTHTISTSDSLTTYFASKSEPIEILGNSTQNGTPTPNNPVEIENVTGLQTIDVTGANLFNAKNIKDTNIVVNDDGSAIKMPVATSGNGYYSTGSTLKELCPSLQVGDTVYLYFDKSPSEYNPYIYINGSNYLWYKDTTRTITAQDLSGIIALYGNRYNQGQTEQVTINNLRIVKVSNTPYEPYINNTYEINLGKAYGKESNNLYNYENTKTVSSGITTDSEGWITATYNNSTGTSQVKLNYFTQNLDLEYNTNYAIFVETKNVNITGGGFSLLAVDSDNTTGQFSNRCVLDNNNISSNSTYRFINTTKRNTASGYVNGLSTYIAFYPGATGSITFRISVLKDTSITTNTFKYESFDKIDVINYSDFVATSDTTLTILDNGIDISNTTADGMGAIISITNAFKNTNYMLSYNFESVSNGYNKVEIWNNSFTYLIASSTGTNQFKFNTGSYSNFRILFYGSNNAIGESKYTNISFGRYVELNKIGTYQDRIFKSSGKNLFDKDNTSRLLDMYINSTGYVLTNGTNFKSLYIPCEPNTTYTISKIQSSRFIVATYTTLTNGSTSTNYVNDSNATKLTITTNSSAKYLVVWYYHPSQDTLSEETIRNSIQIEKGSTSSQFEPYGEPSWYIEKKIGKLILDGSETWNYNSGSSAFYLSINDIKKADNNNEIIVLSDYFLGDTANHCVNSSYNYIVGTNTLGYTWLRYNSFNTTSQLTTWLSTHNTTFYYKLSTPTYTKIENEELVNQLESVLNLYKGVNNITITPQYTNLSPQLKVEFKDGFTHNGLGIITDVLEANVTEQINGDYYLDFRVAINNKLADDLTYNNIISCKVADGTEQFFRIKRVVKTFTEIQIYATHIFYDLIDNVLDNVAPTGLTCADYGRWLLSHTNYWTPFTFNSDMLSWNSGRYIRKNVVESMIGNIDNSMLVKFGGEIVRDNFDIALNYSRGNDNGVILRVGKNIKQIEITTDIDNMATRIIPVGFDGLMIPEKYIDSPLINDYPQPKMAVVEFSDIKYEPLEEGKTPSEDDGTYHVLSEAEQALRDRVYALYNNGADKPSVNVKVDWLELSKTNQYTQYSDLEKVNIGDRITVSILGENYKSAVIKTTYNSLTDMIESFEIGSISGSIVNAVNGNTQTIQNFSPSEILSSAASTANQQLINVLGGTYGYVGGFKIFSDRLACEYYPPADFTQTDLTKLRNYLLDPVANPLTPEEYELYDLKKDGEINSYDLLFMRKLIESGITTSNPLVYSMETGNNILDGGIKITDGNGNNIIQVGLVGYEYKGENITPDVYDVGDTYGIYNYDVNGLITSSTERVEFTIPINGVVKNGTPKVSNAEVVLRGISGYLNGSEANGTITHNKSGYTWSVSDYDSHFTISITKSSDYTNISNNTPVSVSIHSLEITFE